MRITTALYINYVLAPDVTKLNLQLPILTTCNLLCNYVITKAVSINCIHFMAVQQTFGVYTP